MGEGWKGAKPKQIGGELWKIDKNCKGWHMGSPFHEYFFFCNINDTNGRKPLIKGHELEVKVCKEGSSDFL